jgi:hypothetical protein
LLSLDNLEWPDDIDFKATTSNLTRVRRGVYHLTKTEEPVTLIQEGQEAFIEHLKCMNQKKVEPSMEESTFRNLVSRHHLKNVNKFVYNENLVFSLTNHVATSNPCFPVKWNFNDIPGPLKSFCSVRILLFNFCFYNFFFLG